MGGFAATGCSAEAWGSPPTVKSIAENTFEVTFAYQPPAGTRTVHLAGQFNDWSPSAHPMQGPDPTGRFTTTLQLPDGRFEYKFVLDGQHWQTDPDNPAKSGPYHNAVVFVGVNPKSTSGSPRPERVVQRPTDAERDNILTDMPAELKTLMESLDNTAEQDVDQALQTWLAARSMPLIGQNSISFIWSQPGADRVDLWLTHPNKTTVVSMTRLGGPASVFALSVKAEHAPVGTVYMFEADGSGSSGTGRFCVDSHAWTVTSRAGKPVALVAPPDPDRGRIEWIGDVRPSTGKLQTRGIYVYLPPGYLFDSSRRYPVLYMHDGQNCWDDPEEPFGQGGWHVNVTADQLITTRLTEPFIVVGIPNTPDRMTEYGPGTDVTDGASHAYLRYLVRDVKPLIDGRYRTKPGAGDTVLMGSSMGGIISLQAGLLYPEVFGQVGCLSPALEFKDGQGRNYFDLLASTGKQPIRIYLDSGTAGRGRDGMMATRRMGRALLAAGWIEGDDFMRFEHAGAYHNERAWRQRVHRALIFFFERQR